MKLNKVRCSSLNCVKAASFLVSHALHSFLAADGPNLDSSTNTHSAQAGGREELDSQRITHLHIKDAAYRRV